MPAEGRSFRWKGWRKGAGLGAGPSSLPRRAPGTAGVAPLSAPPAWIVASSPHTCPSCGRSRPLLTRPQVLSQSDVGCHAGVDAAFYSSEWAAAGHRDFHGHD